MTRSAAALLQFDVPAAIRTKAMTTGAPKKPFSMIREFHLADWFTLGNAICGTGALFSIMTFLQRQEVRHIFFACGLVLAALVFDVLDGRIARWRQKSSVLGRELDSLADVISFGVAPAVIAYGCGMQGLYDRVVLAYFVACGVSRLARFNVTAEAMSEGARSRTSRARRSRVRSCWCLCRWRGVRRDPRSAVVRRDRRCGFQAAPAGVDVRTVRVADDQPDPHPEAVTARALLRVVNRPRRVAPAGVATEGTSNDACLVFECAGAGQRGRLGRRDKRHAA